MSFRGAGLLPPAPSSRFQAKYRLPLALLGGERSRLALGSSGHRPSAARSEGLAGLATGALDNALAGSPEPLRWDRAHGGDEGRDEESSLGSRGSVSLWPGRRRQVCGVQTVA